MKIYHVRGSRKGISVVLSRVYRGMPAQFKNALKIWGEDPSQPSKPKVPLESFYHFPSPYFH